MLRQFRNVSNIRLAVLNSSVINLNEQVQNTIFSGQYFNRYCSNTASHVINSLIKTLPKMNTKRESRKSRRQILRDGSKYPPASIYLRVVGSGAIGAPRSLYVFMGNASYLFNCGEGTQRLCHETKVKLAGLENVFVTHKSWKNVGGLPGMLLTLQDAGSDQILLHGPPGIHIIYKDTKGMLLFKDLKIACNHHEINRGKFGGGSEGPMLVQAVPIPNGNSSPSSTSQHDDPPLNIPRTSSFPWEDSLPRSPASPSHSPVTSVADLDASERGSFKRQSDDSSSSSEPSEPCKRLRSDEFSTDMAMAYICKFAPKVGPLLLDKCIRAGVPSGPLLGQLKNGNDVTLPSGDVVRAADVKGGDEPGLVFLVVEAPSLGHVESLLAAAPLSLHQSGGSGPTATLVAHFTPPHIVREQVYQQWIDSFPHTTSHIFLNEDNSCMGSEAVHRMQLKMRYLEPRAFPVLHDKSIPDLEQVTNGNGIENTSDSPDHVTSDTPGEVPSKEKPVIAEDGVKDMLVDITNQTIPTADERFVKAVTAMEYHLRPHTKFDRKHCPTIDRVSIESEIAESGCSAGEPVAPDCPAQYPMVTFLGTGSAVPCKTRNVSGILVQLSADAYMLMDCGEGSWGQLVRLLGADGALTVAARLTAVYVSHHHADHHMGLVGILTGRRAGLEREGREVSPLPLLGPYTICMYLRSYHNHFEAIDHLYTFTDNTHFLTDTANQNSTKYRAFCNRLQVNAMETCNVNHCHASYGVAITTTSGKKLVYSGDTRPSTELVRIGKDCDMLIHEATMADDLANDAVLKRHCTMTEALTVARNMRADTVVLTHFSQRYSKLPLLPDVHEEISNVALAYDNMTVGVSDIRRMASLYAGLLKMFSASLDEMKEKNMKRQNDKMRDERIKQDMLRYRR